MVVKAGPTMLKVVDVYGGGVTVSTSVAVDWTVMVVSDALFGSVAIGLTKKDVVAVVRTAPLLGETPFSQLVVPELTP